MRCGWLLLALLSGCGAGDADLEDVDPEAAPARPTWSDHVKPLMDRYCVECHADDAQPGRQGGYGFDTCAETRGARRAFEDTVFDSETMPPGGADRLRAWEQLLMQRWYDQGASCE